ncbi:hypothetical protein SAMN03159448_03977 [Sinorhizobium sp. NFACC03]|nr:hypothetical protein SAMN03159448_03977 [Sinorhizobium sp. NFACC03]
MNIGAQSPDIRRIDETIEFDTQFADPFSGTLNRLVRRVPEFDISVEQMIEDQLEISFSILRIFKSPHEQPAVCAQSLPRRGFPFPSQK